ncbi:toxin VapC [Archaeoglobales archaeon]|nr:MAG: toxin VapC [Archaeoglobales archaeon]
MIFDASAIINICSRGEIEKLEGHTSSLAIYEIGNAIWKQVYQRRKLSIDEGKKALSVLHEVLKNLEKLEIAHPEEVLRIAVNEGLTFYDASYLYLAVKNNLALVTDDKGLYKIAEKHVRVLKSRDL